MFWSNGRLIERHADPIGQLLLAQHAVGRAAVAPLWQIAVIVDVLVERDLLRPVPPPPPPLPVSRLVDDDPVDPGAKGRVAAEGVDGAEHPQEDFLREVERLVVVAQEVQRQLVDHPLVLVDQLGAGVFVARGAALNEGGFPPPDVVQVMARTGFTDSPCAILALHRWGIAAASDGLEPGRTPEVPWPVSRRSARMSRGETPASWRPSSLALSAGGGLRLRRHRAGGATGS